LVAGNRDLDCCRRRIKVTTHGGIPAADNNLTLFINTDPANGRTSIGIVIIIIIIITKLDYILM
jgi:hypothetical protein